ncbi:hypothetical protein E2C01_094921 [Portunus trituberculatus]|uniref:Uncharacterized protein n=1 Tax=Portunus trituberculatus TaxID=210409 RepID=A0A5B7K4F8_PORTR|nr:hypothetical protein [Portunus trituberculatus]
MMRTTIRNTSITNNMASKRYSGNCEKGYDRALYTTKCAAI